MALRLGLGVVLPDIINVKDFLAVGNGVADDRPAIQAAIDSAFGTAGSPHGTNATLNKAIYFPPGSYLLSSGSLVLTQVRGARIIGGGQLATTIGNASGSTITTNGLEYCSFENISFSSGVSATTGVEIDWNGTGSVGLKGNVFTNCGFGGKASYACRIGFSGHGGSNNQFYACSFGESTIAGLVTWSASATGQYVQGGQASQLPTAFWIKAGQIASICDVGLSGCSAQDVLMDSDGPLLMKGNRTESFVGCVFNSATSVAVLDGHSVASGSSEVCRTKGKVICDSCYGQIDTVFCTNASYTGKAYFRGCVFPNASFLTAFAGTIGQNV